MVHADSERRPRPPGGERSRFVSRSKCCGDFLVVRRQLERCRNDTTCLRNSVEGARRTVLHAHARLQTIRVRRSMVDQSNVGIDLGSGSLRGRISASLADHLIPALQAHTLQRLSCTPIPECVAQRLNAKEKKTRCHRAFCYLNRRHSPVRLRPQQVPATCLPVRASSAGGR
ncbi:hypothetical protein GDR29_02355 [Xanthomonas oryzae pv. oryzae]|nr:hypothetical protein GDR29_02355 [Xanthomonas oryzae pv. oryzae]